MASPNPSFFRRLSLAFAILSQPALASQVERLRETGAEPAPPPPPPAPAAPVLREAPHEAALQLLGLLQREARFVDFVQEDVAGYSDADIGAAARVVHEGCRKVLREHFTIEPVSSEPEGSRITLHEGFKATAIRLTGNVVGKPPFTGSLGHRGWRVTSTRLPKLAEGHDAAILAQAEVEL